MNTLPVSAWFDCPYQELPGIIPTGSPDRTVCRHVIQIQGMGNPFVLEGSGMERKAHRIRQAENLSALVNDGCRQIFPWMRTQDGAWGKDSQGLFWQLRPFVYGEPLPRETYGQDAWRGHVLGGFLVQLSVRPGVPHSAPAFSISEYIRALLPRIRERNQALSQDLLPIWQQLDSFAHGEESLPIQFCHGDFHPGNAIWGKQDLQAVIDWEFCGFKTAGYDAANLLGCLGMDAPENLTAPMAMAFLDTLKRQQALPKNAGHWLPELIVALRFGWMREWCWRNDREMMIQELDFMHLILDNRDFLRTRWELC